MARCDVLCTPKPLKQFKGAKDGAIKVRHMSNKKERAQVRRTQRLQQQPLPRQHVCPYYHFVLLFVLLFLAILEGRREVDRNITKPGPREQVHHVLYGVVAKAALSSENVGLDTTRSTATSLFFRDVFSLTLQAYFDRFAIYSGSR